MPSAVLRQEDFVMLSPSHNQHRRRPWEEPSGSAPKGWLHSLGDVFAQFGFSGSGRQGNSGSPGMLLRSGTRKSNVNSHSNSSSSTSGHDYQKSLFGEKRTRDNSNSNRLDHTSQSAEDSEQKIFVSIVVVVVAILFFFGFNSSANGTLPTATEIFTSNARSLVPSNGSAFEGVSDSVHKLPETNGWLPSWLFAQETTSGDSHAQRPAQFAEVVADIKESGHANQHQGVLQEEGVKILKVMSDMKAEQEKIKKDSTIKLAEVGAKAEKAAAAASFLEEGAARRIAALENEVQRLQAALAEQSKSQSAKATAVENHLNEVTTGYKRDLAEAQEQTEQMMVALRSGLDLANEAHTGLAAQVAAAPPGYENFDAAKASLQATLQETVRKAVDAALDERRLKQSESEGNSSDRSNARNSVVSVLRDLYESRTEGIDWLLEINGARVEAASQSFINAPTLLGAVRWLFPGQQEDPRTVLRPASEGAVAVAAGAAGTEPGRCWAMAGSVGAVKVKLIRPIRPRKLVLQHVPLRASVNSCSSALRNFRLLGWRAPATADAITEDVVMLPPNNQDDTVMLPPNNQDDAAPSAGTEEPVELVRGQYQILPGPSEPSDDADRALGHPDEVAAHVQSFVIAEAWEGVRVDRVSLEVEDNHGDERFTCLYHPTLYGEA